MTRILRALSGSDVARSYFLAFAQLRKGGAGAHAAVPGYQLLARDASRYLSDCSDRLI